MNTEAVAEMLSTYIVQLDIVNNLDFLIKSHPHAKTLTAILKTRLTDLQEEQRSIYAMLAAEFTESIKIEDFFYDAYKYITTDPPKGFG